ncbi:MAG: apolipoprotein N-acyltransferase [Actinomycetota bacterium]|nr:apolipoprotein N-acyltransferase [Actinomycetota bacterium]
MSEPLVRLPLALCLAAAAGVGMWAAFPPIGLGIAAVAGVALLTAATWRAGIRRGLLAGLVTGLVFFIPLLHWMSVVGTDAWLMLSLYCGAWLALVGAGTALVTRLPAAPVWVGAVWVLQEALRGRIPWGGFPWGDLAFAQPDTALGALAAYVGAPGLSFVVAGIGAAVVAAIVAFRDSRMRPAVSWLAGAALVAAGSAVLPLDAAGDSVGGPTSASMAVVQGGTPQFGMGALDVRRAVLENHVAQTLDLAAAVAEGQVAQPEFVLWPENSSDLDPFRDPDVAQAITAATRAVGVPILVGAVISADDPTGVWNVGIVWDPELGPTEMYIKTHPVPFGEYIPFRAFLAQHIARFERVPRDFLPGDRPGNLDIAGIAVGNVICFEIAYADVVDAVVDGGARLLTVQTNNATYGGTAQPEQQLAISRLRAIETGRTVAVAATSGISAIIDATGGVSDRMEEGESGWVVAEVPLRGQLTWASRIGHLVEIALCLAALAAILVGASAMVRARRIRLAR